MKVPFKQNIPKWAQASYKEVRAELGFEQLPALDAEAPKDSAKIQGSTEELNIDRAYGTLSQSRSTFRYHDGLDESGEDQAKGEIGKIKLKNGETIWSSGTAEDGVQLLAGDERFSVTTTKDGKSESFFMVKNRYLSGQNLDLSDRQGSQKFEAHLTPEERGRDDLKRTVHAESTTNGAKFLESNSGKEPSLFHDIFLTGEKSMVDVRSDLLTEFQDGVKELPDSSQSEMSEILDKKNATTPRKLYSFLSKESKKNKNPKLAKLRERAGLWQALEDFPKLMADGVMRTSEHYVAPQTLKLMAASQDWEFDKATGLPIADSVVIGAGPGGLPPDTTSASRALEPSFLRAAMLGSPFLMPAPSPFIYCALTKSPLT